MNKFDKTEVGLLGLCLKDKSKFESDVIRLTPEHFTSNTTSLIFRVMENLAKDDDVSKFELPLILEQAARIEPEFDSDEMINVLSDAVLQAALPNNSKKYTKNLIEKKIRRELQKKQELIQRMFDEKKSIEEITYALNSAAMEAQNEENSSFGKSPADFFKDHYDLVMELKGKPFGFLTGWPKFDEMINGFEKGTVTTFAARPSMGKTALGVNIAYKLAERNVKTLFFSAEMSGQDISSRFIPFITDIGTKYNKDYEYLERSKYSKEVVEWGMEKLQELPLLVDDHPALSIEDIEWKLPIYAKEGYKVFIIDYVQFIQMRRKTGQGKDHERIAFIMSSLKTLAKKHDVAIVVLAQIGRGIEARDKNEKRPMLSDLKGSGSIEENSDKVIAIHRPWFYLSSFNSNEREKRSNKIQRAELVVLKNRNGAVGEVPFWYFMDYNAFIEKEEEPPILDWEQYLEKIVRPLKKRGLNKMRLEKGLITQEELKTIEERANEKIEAPINQKETIIDKIEKVKAEREEAEREEERKKEREKAKMEKLRTLNADNFSGGTYE